MKFIKVQTKDDKKAIVNLLNVSYFYALNETQTNVCFINEADYLTINLTIEEFEHVLTYLAQCSVV
jgi:hypothetical protein